MLWCFTHNWVRSLIYPSLLELKAEPQPPSGFGWKFPMNKLAASCNVRWNSLWVVGGPLTMVLMEAESWLLQSGSPPSSLYEERDMMVLFILHFSCKTFGTKQQHNVPSKGHNTARTKKQTNITVLVLRSIFKQKYYTLHTIRKSV